MVCGRAAAVPLSGVAESTIVYLVLAGAVALFVSGRVPVEVVAVGTALSLWATDVLALDEALSGFGDPTVLFLASLFVVSHALDVTGVTGALGQLLVDRAGASRSRLVVSMMLACALLAAILTPNGAVAALVSVIVVTAVRLDIPSSQLMMPLAFSAHAGSLLALTGSPVNVLVSDAAADAGVGGFGFFDYAVAGVPLLAGTVLVVVVAGHRLLPHRSAKVMPRDLSDQAGVLSAHYELDAGGGGPLFDRATGVAEVVVPPRSDLIGLPAFPGMVTESGDLVVVAVHRDGRPVGLRATTVRAGDALLLRGTWDALEVNLADPAVVVVDDPEVVRRHTVRFGRGARRTLVVVGAMVALLVTGAVPPAVAGLLAVGALVVGGVLTAEQAYRGVSWTTIVLVAGMVPLAAAMASSGAADELADGLVSVVGDAGPYTLLVALFVLVVVLGQLISNTATALVVIPVAVSAAEQLDVSPRPVLMLVAVAAAAALLTPVATPANMMVMGPGDYRFGDYARLGLPLLAWYAVVALGLVPLVWRF